MDSKTLRTTSGRTLDRTFEAYKALENSGAGCVRAANSSRKTPGSSAGLSMIWRLRS
jgi:hypothetical protein